MKNRKGGTLLNVPFREKNRAKDLGAWWDPQLRSWYVPRGRDTKPFAKWLPEPTENSDQSLQRVENEG